MKVSVSNTFAPILRVYRERFSGTITQDVSRSEKHKTGYRWQCYGTNALNCVRALLPYLIEKKDQAHLMLLYREFPKASPERKAIYLRCRELKHLSYQTIDAENAT